MVGEAAQGQSVEETRKRIMAAAREIFARNGSRGTTTREIADRAEVNEATVFRHFGTKRQLLQAMLDHYCDAGIEERLSSLDTLSGSLEEQLRAISRIGIERMTERRDLIRISMAEEALHPESCALTWRSPTVAQRKIAEYMRGKIAAGALRGDPDELARLLMSLVFAYVFAVRIWNHNADEQERAIASFVDLFLHGARVA